MHNDGLNDFKKAINLPGSKKTIIVLARKSSRVGAEAVQVLEDRNQLFYKFVLQRVYGGLSSSDADFISIVLNGYSSNYNISTSTRRKELAQLRKTLDTLEASLTARSQEVLMSISSQDGFFTNIAGIYDFFRVYVNINLTLMVFDGGQSYSLHPIKDLVAAIWSVRYDDELVPDNPHQVLVLEWIGISVSKELLASNVRDLRRMLPQRRNQSLIDLANELHVDEDDERVGKDGIVINPKKRMVPYRHPVHQNETGEYICPYEPCRTTIPFMEDLRKHLVNHCKTEGRCILCPASVEPNPYTTAGFRTNTGYITPNAGTSVTLLKEHVQRHLPPTFFCKEEGCEQSFFTAPDLVQHAQSHAKNQLIACLLCGAKFRKTYLNRHLADYCAMRDRSNGDNTYQCAVCSEVFNDLSKLYRHTAKVHQQKDEVIGVAQEARLLDAGLPSLEVGTSTIIQTSIDMRLQQQSPIDVVESGVPKQMEVFRVREEISELMTSRAARYQPRGPRDEILGIAQKAGLFAAGIPSLGLDVSAAVQDSANMRLQQQTSIEGIESGAPDAMGVFSVRGKIGGLRTSEPVRSLRLDG